MEVLIVIGISALIMGISMQAFSALTTRQIVEKDTENIYAVLQNARNKTILGEGNTSYGVKFASSSITLFVGTGYNAASTTNQVTQLSTRTEIKSINLTGATTTLYFSKINGRPSATGTVEIVLKSEQTNKETIQIYASGLSEVQ